MSAVGTDIAVISIGVSCQTSMQIRHHADAISRLTNSRLETDTSFLSESSFPLDWRITPARSFCDMAKRRSMFPDCIDEIDHIPVGEYMVARWLGSHFWHDHIDANTFDAVRSKFAHTTAKLFSPCRRRIFILSNTQNNLDMTAQTLGVDFSFSGPLIEAVKEALDNIFPGESPELVVVTSADRAHGDVRDWVAPTYLIDRSTTPSDDVFGDGGQWGAIFEHYFTRVSATAA